MRTHTILALSSAFFAVALVVIAYIFFGSVQPSPGPRLPLILVVRNPPALDAAWNGFRSGMEELGYREGETVRYIVTEVGADLPATKERITAFLSEKPDLIYTMGVLAVRAAKEATAAQPNPTPIVFGVVSDPVGSGIVASMQRPGGNITGITPASNFTASKRLELLREMLPGTKRVIHPWNDEKTSGIIGLRTLAPILGFTLVEKKVANVADMKSFLQSFTFEEGDTLLRPSDSVGAGAMNDIITLTLEKKVPLIGTNEGDTERGALMSYGADYESVGKSAARMADLILRGTPPSDISVEEAAQFYLSLNLDTAKHIGISIPDSFLLKAHRIIASE